MTARLNKIKSGSTTVRYFEKDSGIAPSSAAQYYAGQDFEHNAASAWFGRGARMLKLKGPVDSDTFHAVLTGRVPGTGIRLGRRVVNEETGRTRYEHNPGDDLTFSAPKSVSLAALHFQEAEALDAHDRAVARTLYWIQEHHIETRRNQKREQTGRMVAATFRHDTSRNHDPQLHTHCIIANMTRRKGDETWTSIDRGSVSLNEQVIEAYYHNELAKNLMEAGYRLRPVRYGAKRVFEIEGYADNVLDAFSTRKHDILRDLREKGIRDTSAARQRAALRTRRAKEAISREELHRRWDGQAAKVGLENPSSKLDRWRNRKEQRQLKARGIEDPLGRNIDADLHRAVGTALEHLGYHTPVISDVALKAAVMGRLAGRVSLERIEGALATLEKDGHLYRSKRPRSRGAWVTREALIAEKGVVKHMREGRGRAEAIRPGFDAAVELAGRGLTPGQSAAIEAILTATDRVSGVQGYAGTGKTTMLRTMVEKVEGRRFIGLAPTVGASILLGSEAGMPSQTLQKFLVQHKDTARADDDRLEELRREYRDTVIVVDEASMIGTRQMEQLFAITEALAIERLVLVGDKKQLRSVEAGQPFTQLQKHGMATAIMQDIVRQKDMGLKVPVQMMLAGNVSCALERLNDEDNRTGRLVEVASDDLHLSAARLYLGLSEEDRRGTIVMAQTNHDRQEINERIRDGLEEEGHLGGMEYEGVRLVPRHMTPAEKKDALNYEPGDVLVFQPQYGTKDGEDHFAVKEVGRDGRILAEAESGQWRHFNPGKGKMAYQYEVYTPQDISLMENDRVRFTRNDPDYREKGVVNGADATVEKIGPKRIALRMATDDPSEEGNLVHLHRDHNALKHLDHGYCRTTYSAQGRTADRVIAVADTGLGHIADQQNFYVQISRPTKEAVVVTDDIVELGDSLAKHTGEVLSAMEAVEPPKLEAEQAKEIRRDMEKDIEMPDRLDKGKSRDAEIRLPGSVVPNQFPPEVVAMLQRADPETVPAAIIEAEQAPEREIAAQPDHPQPTAPGGEAEPPSPAIEGRGIGIGIGSDAPDEEPEAEIEPPPPPVEEEEAEQAADQQPDLFDHDALHADDDANEKAKSRPAPKPDKQPVQEPEAGPEAETEAAAEPVLPAPTPYIGLDPEDVPEPMGQDMGDRALRNVRLPEAGGRAQGVIGTGFVEAGGKGLNAKAAETWWKTGKARESTGILAMPDRQREIAGIIRAWQKKEGQLQSDAVEVGRRVMVPLVGKEKTADRFVPGDTLILGAATGGSGIKPDSTVVVLGWDRKENPTKIAVRGVRPDGEAVTALLDPSVVLDGQIFRHIPMELMVGDRVRWRAGFPEFAAAAGDTATITAIEESGKIELASDDSGGKARWAMPIGHRAFGACDYAFDLSALDIKLGMVENVVAVLDANRPDIGIVNAVRRELGRQAGNTVIVTDDFGQLNKQLERAGKPTFNVGQGIEGLVIGKNGIEGQIVNMQKQGRGKRLRF